MRVQMQPSIDIPSDIENLDTLIEDTGFTPDQGFALETEGAFCWYSGQFGGSGLSFDAAGYADGAGYAATTLTDPYIHWFNLDIGSVITA